MKGKPQPTFLQLFLSLASLSQPEDYSQPGLPGCSHSRHLGGIWSLNCVPSEVHLRLACLDPDEENSPQTRAVRRSVRRGTLVQSQTASNGNAGAWWHSYIGISVRPQPQPPRSVSRPEHEKSAIRLRENTGASRRLQQEILPRAGSHAPLRARGPG